MAATQKIWSDNNPPQADDVDLNGFKEENNRLISTSGQGLNTSDNDQTTKAVAIYASGGADYYTDSGTANAYILTITGTKITPPAYYEGMKIRFVPANINTGACVVNVNGLGLTNLKNISGSTLDSGDLPSGIEIQATYIGGEFRLNGIGIAISINNQQKSTYIYADDVGSVNTIVVNPSVPYAPYVPGTIIEVLIANTNTGPSTLQISSHGAVAIQVGTPLGMRSLAGNEMVSGCIAKLQFNGSAFQLLYPMVDKVFLAQVSFQASSNQTITGNTTQNPVKVLLNNVLDDLNGWWDVANHKFTNLAIGRYRVNMIGNISAATGSQYIVLYKNGNYFMRVSESGSANPNLPTLSGSVTIKITSNSDYLEFFAGGSNTFTIGYDGTSVGNGNDSNLFEIEYLGT